MPRTPPPGAGADQLAEPVAAEQVGEYVAVRGREMIDQADFRPADQFLGFGACRCLAVGAHFHQHAAQPFQHHGCDEAAAVPAVVDDERVARELGVELAHELLQAELFHVRQVDVANSAAGEFVDDRAVVVDPGLFAHRQLGRHRLYDQRAGCAAGAVGDRQLDLLVRLGGLHQRIGVPRRMQLDAVDRQQVVTGLDAACRARRAGCGSRRASCRRGRFW